jgi:hypothetical protein
MRHRVEVPSGGVRVVARYLTYGLQTEQGE